MSTISSSTDSILNTTSSANSQAKLSEDLDTFLYLLTTQLKHQDPLSPMDTTEFTNQLVQFANVEQSIQTNKNLESLLSYNRVSLGTMAVNYLGNTIQAASNYMPLQDGASKFTYTLAEDADNCVIAIEDASGNIIRALVGDKSVGTHTLEWDGYDNDGNKMPDGAYKINITAMNDNGSLDVFTTVFGRATAVANEDDGVYMAIGDVVIKMDDIIAVREYQKVEFDDEVAADDTANDGTDIVDDVVDEVADNEAGDDDSGDDEVVDEG